MIQFNLLPDVKLEYLKTTRAKRAVTVIASITASVALAVFLILLVSVRHLQKNHLDNLDKDVKKNIADIQAIPEINKILTIQNQLNSLPGLHDQKPVTSRLFGYLTQITPVKANISDFEIDYLDAKTIKIEGDADALSTINQFVDTMKFTEYSVTYTEKELEEGKKKPCAFQELRYDAETRTQVCTAFSKVVLTDFDLVLTSVSYEINLVYDPIIFDSNTKVTLIVPKITTTRSETEKPNPDNPLFKETPKAEEETR